MSKTSMALRLSPALLAAACGAGVVGRNFDMQVGFPPERGGATTGSKGSIIFEPQIGPRTPTFVATEQCVFENQGNGRFVAEKGEHTNAEFQRLYPDYSYRGESGSTDINDDCGCPINWTMEEQRASAAFYEVTGYRANFDIEQTPSCRDGGDSKPDPSPAEPDGTDPSGGCQCDGRGDEPDGPGGTGSGNGGNAGPGTGDNGGSGASAGGPGANGGSGAGGTGAGGPSSPGGPGGPGGAGAGAGAGASLIVPTRSGPVFA